MTLPLHCLSKYSHAYFGLEDQKGQACHVLEVTFIIWRINKFLSFREQYWKLHLH